MEIEVKIEELRKKKIFVATPMYGGQCCGMYTKSSCDLATIATQYGMDVRFFYLFNESLITRARNYLVDEFLRSDYTHLMFIDSDTQVRELNSAHGGDVQVSSINQDNDGLHIEPCHFLIYLLKFLFSNYFQNICTNIIPIAKIKDVAVFQVIPSPIKYQVNIA